MKKLLIVDDNLDFLGFLVSILKEHFEVYEASGVKEALQVLENPEIEAVCSDFNMKDGTGLNLLEEIRQKGITVPFLLMSGDDDCLLEQKTKLCRGVFCSKADYDLIEKINGNILTTENYLDLYYSSEITLSLSELTDNAITPTKDVSLTAIEMYENPILCYKTFDVNGKKIGYLAYNSFDLKSIQELISICEEFKNEGVKELILDLRYNGGGYVITKCVLASMFAPQEVVTSKEIFEQEDYNEFFTEYYKKNGISTITRFETEYNYDDIDLNVSTKEANIGLEKIYGIISGNSASASEALLSGLMPYMDIELIGQQSHGKYCTGWMLSTEDAYDKVPQAIKNWGIYVMVSIYKNASNETPCMPDGLIPDTEAEDNPFEPYQLGDENEAMLKAALEKAGKEYTSSRTGKIQTPKMKIVATPKKAVFGRRIIIPSQSHMPDNE